MKTDKNGELVPKKRYKKIQKKLLYKIIYVCLSLKNGDLMLLKF